MEKRNTIQKELVLNAVNNLGCHATADEIYEAVSAECSSVSKGTVYRNLHVLSEEGKIKRVEVLGGADHFDHNCFDHWHVQCTECGRVFDVEMSEDPAIMKKIKKNDDIEILDYEITFRGICSECDNKKEI